MRWCLALALPAIATAQTVSPRSAPIRDVRYDVTVDSETVVHRDIDVAMHARVESDAPIILSLPAWSPGHYTLLWFARRVSHFTAEANGKPLDWRLADYQTWRIVGAKPGQQLTVRFSYLADTIDRAVAWTRPDFAFFNGTNLFLYPVGQGFDWPATVTVHTSPAWRIATGLDAASTSATYSAPNYHDLVDAPFFVGHFDLDSAAFGSGWLRFANYPADLLGPERMRRYLDDLVKLARTESAIFHATPWRTYTVLQIVDAHPNGGGLEHHNSQLDEIPTGTLDAPYVVFDFAHEMFHAWNVKRLRPADLVPYRYDRAQPTPWLWVSEGISDYYSDLAIVRSGIGDSTTFLDRIAGYMSDVAAQVPSAMTDASLQTWIGPTDGTWYLYYSQGALAGFALDVLIRDASNDRQSLDDVMRGLYDATYQRGRGFTPDDWWGAVQSAAGGRSFAALNHRFIEGRERFPWDSILPLAGLRLVTDTIRDVDLGVTDGSLDSLGFQVLALVPGGPAARAGIEKDDIVTSIGGASLANLTTFSSLRETLRSHMRDGQHATYTVRRSGQTVTGEFPVAMIAHERARLELAPNASAKAQRIRHAIFAGARQ